MLKRLQSKLYSIIHNIPEMDLFPIISSVINSKQSGIIYVDNFINPNIILVLHKSNFGYLHVSKDYQVNYEKLLDFIYSEINIPQYFHLYNSSAELIEKVQLRQDFNCKIRDRMRMNRVKPYKVLDTNTFDFTAKTIHDIDINELTVFNLEFIEKFWTSKDSFLKDGFGWVIYDQNKPVSIFYTLCVVNKNSETDILTLPEYRGKGLASIAGNLILNTLEERDINMDWDVFEDNIPSVRIGEKFGFSPYFRYKFLSMFKNLG
jgi:RimJ/RimL family protein N-acetyltransferase